VQRPALKLKVDALSIFFGIKGPQLENHASEGLLSYCFSLYCGEDSPSVGLSVHFSLTLHLYTTFHHQSVTPYITNVGVIPLRAQFLPLGTAIIGSNPSRAND
jgi:hypothetical protein